MSEEQGQFVGSIPRSVVRIWMARLGMIVFCAACLGVVWWSLFLRLQPINAEQRAKTVAMTRLSDDVDLLRIKLSAEPVEKIETGYKEATDHLFADADQIQRWQDDTAGKASDLGLDAKIELTPTQGYPGMDGRLDMVEANIELVPVATGFTNSAYQRILKFVQGISASGKRCDVKALTVEGNFKSIQRAKAVVELLAEPKGTP